MKYELFGEDFTEHIKTLEDHDKFKRMEHLAENELKGKPIQDCLDFVIEYDDLANDLQGLPRRKWILVHTDPQMN